jgi:hypothetical protein
MNWLLRGAFMALIALTLGLRLALSPPPRSTEALSAAITRTLEGRLAGPVLGRPWSATFTVYAAPVGGCEDPLIIVASPANFSATDVLQHMGRPGDHVLYAYGDWLADRPDRWRMLRGQISMAGQAALGLKRYANADEMLFIAEPAGCEVARHADWRRFWTG